MHVKVATGGAVQIFFENLSDYSQNGVRFGSFMHKHVSDFFGVPSKRGVEMFISTIGDTFE